MRNEGSGMKDSAAAGNLRKLFLFFIFNSSLFVSVSGQAVTPGGPVEICTILGREESLRRMDAGIAKLEEGVQA